MIRRVFLGVRWAQDGRMYKDRYSRTVEKCDEHIGRVDLSTRLIIITDAGGKN